MRIIRLFLALKDGVYSEFYLISVFFLVILFLSFSFCLYEFDLRYSRDGVNFNICTLYLSFLLFALLVHPLRNMC